MTGFNAYQQKDYPLAVNRFAEVLRSYPDTPMRDLALFWLARSCFKNGNQQDAARYMSQFNREYPDNPLKSTAEDELLALAVSFDKEHPLLTAEASARNPQAPNALPVTAQPAAPQAVKDQQAKEQAAKAEQERLARVKLEQDRQAKAKLEQERLAKEKAAREKAEQERLARVKLEQERLAKEKLDQERLAKEKAAREKAEQERLARVKLEQERVAAEKTRQEKQAAEKAEQQRKAKLAAEQELLAKRKVEEERVAKASLREKAIAQFKSVIEKYPSSTAAVAAAAKLKELGVAVALPPQGGEAENKENTQVLKIEVGHYVGFEFNLPVQQKPVEVARRNSIPFTVINRGNGDDSFLLESAFPAEFKAMFTSADAPEKPLKETPKLASGEVFHGVVSFEIPPSSIDGLKIAYPVKAVSVLLPEASQSREVAVTASAPLLRAVLKSDKSHLLPGGLVAYRLVILNIGSMAARDVTLNLSYPPQLEPQDYSATGLKQGMRSVMISSGLRINSGESREFNIVFRLKDDTLAGQELITRAELVDNLLNNRAAFVSNVASIDPQHGVTVRSASDERQVVIPGQTTSIPLVVTNTGNVSEKYRIAAALNAPHDEVRFYHDINRDGIHQANEPAISEIGPLAPKEEVAIIAEFKTPRSVSDGTEDTAIFSITPEDDVNRQASASTRLFYSRPSLKLAITARDARLKPGEVASFDLVVTNSGSNMAQTVELHSSWPEQLELVGADPANSSSDNGNIIWKFKELGAGEKRSIRVSFKVKHGIGVGTSIQVKNILTYEDQAGNRY